MGQLTLYEITSDLAALVNTLDMIEDPVKRAECEAEIARLISLQLTKIDHFCQFLAHLESQAELCAHEIDRIKGRQYYLKRTLERLENYAIRVMEEQETRKLDGETSSLRLRQNPPAVEITDAAKVPDEYRIVVETVSFDKRAIKKALETGSEVPGADLKFGRITLVRK